VVVEFLGPTICFIDASKIEVADELMNDDAQKQRYG
jgi:hypothetical protein